LNSQQKLNTRHAKWIWKQLHKITLKIKDKRSPPKR